MITLHYVAVNHLDLPWTNPVGGKYFTSETEADKFKDNCPPLTCCVNGYEVRSVTVEACPTVRDSPQ